MSFAGRGVLVTRPANVAAALAERIERAGARAIVFPTVEIAEVPRSAAFDRLEAFALAVFVSPTAVDRAFRLVQAWPDGLPAAAVGPGSARQLERRGVREVLVPRSADSESLLALPQLAQVDGKRVVVFRGEGGRELLGETLRARGARVEYAEVYRRTRPQADPAPLLDAWKKKEVHAVTVTSAAALRNFAGMLGEPGVEALRGTPLFAGHERVAAEARRLEVREVLVAGTSDEEMRARLVAYFEA